MTGPRPKALVPNLEEFAAWSALNRALRLAAMAHSGQTDKAGEPDLWHVMRVGVSLLPDVDAARVGLLHDVLEDSNISGSLLADVLDGRQDLIHSVALLTRPSAFSYEAYIDRIGLSQDRIAIRVKLADLDDNLDPNRMERALAKGTPSAKINQLRRRYLAAQTQLAADLYAMRPVQNASEV